MAYRTVLRDIYELEELRIESEYSRKLKEIINQLCITCHEKFEECFIIIKSDIERIKNEAKSKRKEPPFARDLFLYMNSSLPSVIKHLPKRRSRGFSSLAGIMTYNHS